MTPAEVTDAMLQTALSAVYGQPTRLDEVDPDTLDSWRLGIAAVLTLDTAVYIAEVIWFEENPVDGRTRIAVCASLDSALTVLREHEIHGGDLVATETTSALGTDTARTWAVHEKGTEPDDEGCLWITAEDVRR
jgi:hypothetical protein